MIWAIAVYDSVCPCGAEGILGWRPSGRGVTYVNVTKDACSPQHWPVQVDRGLLAFGRHRPGNVSLEHPNDCLPV